MVFRREWLMNLEGAWQHWAAQYRVIMSEDRARKRADCEKKRGRKKGARCKPEPTYEIQAEYFVLWVKYRREKCMEYCSLPGIVVS